MRRILLAILVLGVIGTTAELLLLSHDEGVLQLIPLVLMAVGLFVIGWHLRSASSSSLRALRLSMLSFVLAGVVGSKIASELGNMRVSEQIDALEIMGINTKTYLVLPKILAALMMIPLLIVISMGLGIWGGRVAGVTTGILSPNHYDRGLLENFVPYNVFFALVKAYTFAFIISSIPAYFGYNVKGGALEIGRASTRSVVVSCIMILFADYILAQLLLNSSSG